MLRYGNARDLCLGVEAVMADGSVLAGVGRLVKDNMGYDLRHLLIGSEGTLAIITAASLRLFPEPGRDRDGVDRACLRPPSRSISCARCAPPSAARSPPSSSSTSPGLDFLAETMPQVPLPPAMGTGWRVLVEATDGVGRRARGPLRGGARRGARARASPPTR